MDPTTTAWGTELTTVNRSDPASSSPVNTETLVLCSLTIVVASIGLAGNTVVLWLLGFCVRRNPFSVYILNLAAADFLFLCFQVVVSLQELISTFPFATFHHLSTMIICSYLAGLSMLSAIGTERCLSVLCPIWYRCHRPRHTSAVTCAVLWALSLLLSILDTKHCGFLYVNLDHYLCQTFDFLTAAWLIFLFVVLSGSSLALLVRILVGSRRVKLTRLYVTIGLTVLVFLSCGLPVGILEFLWHWIQKNHVILSFPKKTTFFLSSINSSANPIIYFFVGSYRRQRQRGTLKRVLEKAFEDVAEVERSVQSLPRETVEVPASP